MIFSELIFRKGGKMKTAGKNDLPKMPHGEGSFSYKAGKVYFRKRITLNNGVKKTVSVYGITVKECISNMKKEEVRLNKGIVEPCKETLGVAMIFWLENYKKNELKVQSYQRLSGTIKNQICDDSISCERYQSITSDELQVFINKFNNGKNSYSTIKKVYDALNAFYRYASLKYKIDNPMLLVVKPTKNNTKKKCKELVWFEQDDIDKFVSESGAKWGTGRAKYSGGLVYAANMFMGLRIGELLALQWKDIDFKNKKLYVGKTLIEEKNDNYDKNDPNSKKVQFVIQDTSKTGVNRYVPLNEKAINLLTMHKDISNYTDSSDFVISTCNRKTTTPKNANDTIKSIQKAAGTSVQNASSHSLRHTFASQLYKKGIRSEIIADFLGNSPEVMRTTYLHFEEKLKYDAIDKLAREAIEL